MQLEQIHPNKIRQGLFLLLLVFLFILIFKELYFFVPAFLGAVTLYVIMRKWMIKMCIKYKMKKWLAALLLILGSFIILVLPMAWVGSIAYKTIKPILQNPDIIRTTFEQIHQYLLTNFDVDVLNKSNVDKISAQVLPFAQSTIGGTLTAVGSIFVMYFILFFMLTQNVSIELWVRKNMPFKNSNTQKFVSEFKNLVYSNAVGIPIVAVIQGIAGMIGYFIFGVKSFVLMGILTAICSVIPMVGPTLVWLPVAIYMMSLGEQGKGIGVILWGFIVVGSVDNIARFVLQKRMADVHPLITIFGVIMGLSLFGFIGLVFGPLLLSMFFLMVKIYIDEFGFQDAVTPDWEHDPDEQESTS